MDMHRLISEVKLRPALWDPSNPDHANRVETHQLWRSVAEALGSSVELCRSKWKNLRCSYRRYHRRQSQQMESSSSPAHQWPYAEAMNFLDWQRSKFEEDEGELELEPKLEETEDATMTLKSEPLPADQMEADNDALMEEFQSITTPQALRRLSHSISLASAAAEEEVTPALPMPPPPLVGTAQAAAAVSSCHCARRVDEQVNFLENLEREEQQLMQSTSQDLARCKNVLHVGDSDYNYLISFLPLMKKMSPLQNVFFRAKMGELLLQTMQEPPVQQQQQQEPQPSQMLLNQQQMALDQAQVSTSTTNWN